MCVNNLFKVALDSAAAAGIELAISSRKSNALSTTSPSHTNLPTTELPVFGSRLCSAVWPAGRLYTVCILQTNVQFLYMISYHLSWSTFLFPAVARTSVPFTHGCMYFG